MESEYELVHKDDITHIKYSNLYYINDKFYFFTLNKDIIIHEIKTLGGPEHTQRIKAKEYILSPIIKYFDSIEHLTKHVNALSCKEYNKPTLYFSHYYDHNIAHGLYDALYPIYLCYLNFYNKHSLKTFNMFVNTLVDPGGWKMPDNYRASRGWVLNVFKDFCNGGEFMTKNNVNNNNIKFNILLAGTWHAGISIPNKKFVMPGKDLYVLEKFRDRFFKVYNIKPTQTDKLRIFIINSNRYTKEEKKILIKLSIEYAKNDNIETKFISWHKVITFKEQLEIMNDCHIHVSGAGTSMMNFPFLNDESVHVNLGVTTFCSRLPKPSLMETNICLLSNNIYCDFYDIYKHKEIMYSETKKLIDKNIYNLQNNIYLKTIEPDYMIKWRNLCQSYPLETNELLKHSLQLL